MIHVGQSSELNVKADEPRIDKVIGLSSGKNNEDREDNDFMVDEENPINDVEDDMEDFRNNRHACFFLKGDRHAC